MSTENKPQELRFDEPFDDQDWLDIGADLRIKIRKQFYQLKKENDRLKAEKEKLKSEFNEIWTPAFGELKAEITKLREQVKDYEGALKTIENKDTEGNNERALCDSVNLAREVLKKWSKL